MISGPSSPDLACTEIPTVLGILLWLATGEDLFQQDITHSPTVYLQCLVNLSWHFITVYRITQFLQRIQTTRKLYSWSNDPFPMNYSFPHVFFFLHFLDAMSSKFWNPQPVSDFSIFSMWMVLSLFLFSMLNLVYPVFCPLSQC